jgi:hypothetical protein
MKVTGTFLNGTVYFLFEYNYVSKTNSSDQDKWDYRVAAFFWPSARICGWR